jgi:predicted transcriptional regulator
MPNSMQEYMQQDMECEGLLECLHGLKELDREVYMTIVGSPEPLTVDEIADRVDRERSTAYRAVKRLQQTGFVAQEQVNYDQGGYYHVYRPMNPDAVADDMQSMLNEWYAKMGTLIGEFREKYDEQATPPEASATSE